jgi:hypothetical protein
VASIPPHIGPASALDIPIDEILQITIDFPRVIVETVDRVFIGPWSAFEGIPEEMSLRSVVEEIPLITAGLRAIALNDNALHEVPREWLGDSFLTRPSILRREAAVVSRARVTVPDTEQVMLPTVLQAEGTDLMLAPEETVEDLFPTYPVESEPAEQQLPWWVILIGVGALAVVSLLSTGGSSS